MGGYSGIAEAMGFANELQGDGTVHGHGFVSLANAYQYGSLQDIASLIEATFNDLTSEEVLSRLTSFMEHLERQDHIDDDQHQADLESLEKGFRQNNDGDPKNIFLSARPRSFYERPDIPSLWDKGRDPADQDLLSAVGQDAAAFKKNYDADVQFIFGRVQHHWHPLNKKGEREAPKYCKNKNEKLQGLQAWFPKAHCKM